MTQTFHQFDLTEHNSFSFPAICPTFFEPTNLADLIKIIEQQTAPFYILGEGSNTLFVEQMTTDVIHPKFEGITVQEESEYVDITAMCGENWHNFVQFCVESGYPGLENLALIPGSIGAAPVQNIGAYGVEVSDVIKHVKWLDFDTQQTRIINNENCKFGYRDSIFKNKLANKGCIIEVVFRLKKFWQPKLNYAGLDELSNDCTLQDVFNKVISIRQSKLPNPIELPNAGSFFKNPILTSEHYQQLKDQYPSMPSYLHNNGQYKVAAGWLIEQSGLKGLKIEGVGVHEKQALVLVNYKSREGQCIIRLAKHVQNVVERKFNIMLTPEVRLLSKTGLVLLEQCKEK